jgi:peptidoglycan/LPS O-acetylase OafA/YrhL
MDVTVVRLVPDSSQTSDIDAPPLDYQPRRADRPLPVRYMPQLDALRALAVFAVWFEHWGIKDLPGLRYVPWGQFGVWLFFVLSGFLITGILLRSRESVERARQTGSPGGLWAAARSFYARRFLRILPIYYITLFATVFLLHYPGMRQVFWWHLAYATNFRVAIDPSSFPNQGGFHFWTLAVEEQFYLIWPALILLVPKRHVLKTIFLALASGLIFRVACVLLGQRGAAGVWPFACFDLFAYGAAVAALGEDARYRDAGAAFCRWCARMGTPALLILLAAAAWHQREGPPGVPTVNLLLDPLAAGAVFAALIARTARGFTGMGKAVLEFKPLLYLGRISYGLYIYHNFMQRLLWLLFDRLHLALPTHFLPAFGIRAAATILIASASWYLIEKPVNGLKRFFEYAKPAAAKPAPSPQVLPPPAPIPDAAA